MMNLNLLQASKFILHIKQIKIPRNNYLWIEVDAKVLVKLDVYKEPDRIFLNDLRDKFYVVKNYV